MGFNIKQWKNRISEYANRRLLTDANAGTEQLVLVTRNEGTITEEGDAFNATNMNDLETRISDALDTGKSFVNLSQSEFEAISTKDNSVYYMIWED